MEGCLWEVSNQISIQQWKKQERSNRNEEREKNSQRSHNLNRRCNNNNNNNKNNNNTSHCLIGACVYYVFYIVLCDNDTVKYNVSKTKLRTVRVNERGRGARVVE